MNVSFRLPLGMTTTCLGVKSFVGEPTEDSSAGPAGRFDIVSGDEL